MSSGWTITAEEYEERVDYTIRWSPWGSMDKWVINRIVPSEAGLIQLWVRDGRGLSLLNTEMAYYGGLRNSLREIIDEMAPAGAKLRREIRDRECWFRYSISSARDNLLTLRRWFRAPHGTFSEDGRDVAVNEIETYEKYPLPPPDIQIPQRNQMSDAEFGPPLPKPLPHRRYTASSESAIAPKTRESAAGRREGLR